MSKKSELCKMHLIWIVLAALAIAAYAETTVYLGETNLTIWDESDAGEIYDSSGIWIYANFTNMTLGAPISDASCNITIDDEASELMDYDETNGIFQSRWFIPVGNHSYNISCNRTGYAWLNASENLTITNREPVQFALLPNITLEEDSFNATINLSNYFIDPDSIISGHTLEWNYTPADNLTIVIVNQTGMMNITPDRNFYGVRNINITAIDPLNASKKGNQITINVTNKPEVNITSPENGNNEYYRNDTVVFRAIVYDNFSIENCSLLIDGTINQTNSSGIIHNGSFVDIKDDDGDKDSNRDLDESPAYNITKQVIVNSQVSKIKIYAFEYWTGSDTSMGAHLVYINGVNAFNISDADLEASSNPEAYKWIEFDVNFNFFILGVINNITIKRGSWGLEDSIMRIGIDTDNDYGRSYYNSGTDETGEYMIRLVYDSREITFEQTNISKGDHTWNVLCVNNQSQFDTSDEDFILSIKDSPASVPDYVTCNGAECEGTIESTGTITVSCGGSTDIDGDDFDYYLAYIKLGESETELTTFDGTSYEWDISEFVGQTIKLRCSPETATSKFNETDYFTISIPDAPPKLSEANITCNGGYCNNSIFNTDIINISCNISGNYNYWVEARYLDFNGSNLARIQDYYPNDGANNISWNTASIMNQTNVSIWCYVNNSIAYTKSNETRNLTILKDNAPTKPLAGIIFEDGSIVHINCSGSTGAGNINYTAFASYKTGRYKTPAWHILGTDLGDSDYVEFNGSQIYEQNVTFKCQAYNGTYYSMFSGYNYSMLSHPPSNPTSILPSQKGNYEYQINYSCAGSNNTEQFTYNTEAYYNSAWTLINDTFPGIIEIEPGSTHAQYISYNDGSAASSNNFVVLENISNGNYQVCIKASGTSSLALRYNCQDTSCSSAGTFNSVSLANQITTTSRNYCANISLTRTGQKIFKIVTGAENAVDSISFQKLPFAWNVSGIPRQKNVQFRCRAFDSQGYSGYIYSNNLTINRVPRFNETEYSSASKTVAYGSSIEINLSKWFYDTDNDLLNFTSTSSLHLFPSINQTTKIMKVSAGGPNCDASSIVEHISITAGDNITNTTHQVAFSVSSCPQYTSKGSRTEITEEEAKAIEETAALTDVSGTSSAPSEPKVEQPLPAPEPPKREETKEVIESQVIQRIFDTKVKHTREFYVSGSKTRVVEKVKNIGFYELEDTAITVTIPKSVAESASEIIPVDPFTVIEDDPVISFLLPKISTGQEIGISYIIDRKLAKSEVESITVNITPKQLSAEELAAKEREVQAQIENTSKYVEVTTKFSIKEGLTEFQIDLDIPENTILYNVSIFAEIPKCLVEILKDEMIESEIDFEIINEDPLIKWHFEKLSVSEEIRYLIKKVADEDCTNQMNVMPLAKKIMILTKNVNKKNAFLPILLVPVIIILITSFSAFGFEERERMKSIEKLIEWAKKKSREGFSWKGIEESLRMTRRYSEIVIRDVIYFSSNAKKNFLKKMNLDIEVVIVVLLLAIGFLDLFHFVPGEIAFAKIIVSWTLLGYVLYRVSITRVLIGKRSKLMDIVMLSGFFLLISKNIINFAEAGFAEAGYVQDLYAVIVSNSQLIDNISFKAGALVLVLSSLWIAAGKKISEHSFMGAVGEFGLPPPSVIGIASRALFLVIADAFLFIVVFNLMMEWLAIAVDSALVTAGIVFYLFVLIRYKHKHWFIETLYKAGNIGEGFYADFINMFRNSRTILIGITGMLMLHTLTEIGVFIIPYILGIYNPIYLTGWGGSHMPIFNIFGALAGLFGHAGEVSASLFGEGIAGMGLSYSAVLFGMYVLNLIAIVFLLSVNAFVWYHLYRNRSRPVSGVKKLVFSRFTLSACVASFVAFALASAFRIKGLYFKGLMGVDILTQNIAQNPNLDLIFAVSIASGILAYMLMRLSSRARPAINWIVIIVSFAFFLNYMWLFSISVTAYYSVTVRGLAGSDIFKALIMFMFMGITIIFYGVGIIALGLELWLRNEIGLWKIFRTKKLPEWASYFDMSLIHHEEHHDEEKHGSKADVIKDYIMNELGRGHNFSAIISNLAKSGWSTGTVQEALLELEQNREFRSAIRHTGKINVKSVISLANFIKKEDAKGIGFPGIVRDVIKAGWTEAGLVDALIVIGKASRKRKQ